MDGKHDSTGRGREKFELNQVLWLPLYGQVQAPKRLQWRLRGPISLSYSYDSPLAERRSRSRHCGKQNS